MLRVGLTGELGSGKSTVARLLAAHGAHIFSSDDTGRALMQPGQPVFAAILDRFGPEILTPDGILDRPALARLAFHPDHPRVAELNAIVHPAVLALQERQLQILAKTDPNAVAVIESALLFTTKHGGTQQSPAEPWRNRFDRIVLVTAPEEIKLARFVLRIAAGRPLTPDQTQALEADGRARLATQRFPPQLPNNLLYLRNDGTLEDLLGATDRLWTDLQQIGVQPICQT